MREIKRLTEIGVLEWQSLSEWAALSFIQPKKNGTVRFLTNFRELNKRLVRKPFPYPKSVQLCMSWKASLMQQPKIYIWVITP